MQVSEKQIMGDLATAKFEWDHPAAAGPQKGSGPKGVTVVQDAATACHQAHALVVLTEWDEFKKLDFQKLYEVRAPLVLVLNACSCLFNCRR